MSKIIELFPNIADIQKKMLEQVLELNTREDLQKYLRSLEPYVVEFPRVTENQIKKLFPKNKKLKIPDLALLDYRYITYLGWIDISTNKLFIVYNLHGQVVGIEGKYTPTNKKGYCFLCNRNGDVGLFTAVSKSRPVNSLPDYYKAFGNYTCMNSRECNKHITDNVNLERFIQNVIG